MAGHDDSVNDLRRAVAGAVDWPGVDERTMFGCPSFTADGELFAVVSEQGVSITKLPDDDRASLAETVDVSPFDAGGRSIDAWATVPLGAADVARLRPYLRASYETALESD